MKTEEAKELKVFAKQIQIATMQCIGALGVGHVGGALSIAHLLATLYGKYMRVDPQNPKWEERDYLVLSKGHAGPALYATLALKGFFEMDRLGTLNRPGTTLPSHADRNLTPGVDMTCGSLGQGASAAAGIAWAHKSNHADNYTYLILGDGELDEGEVWESALFAATKKLDHLIAFVDRNMYQLDGTTEDVCALSDVAAKFREFGWFAETVDGHDPEAIGNAIEKAQSNHGKPSMIVLNTIKGEGWSKSAGKQSSHSMTVTGEDTEQAVAEMRTEMEKLMQGA